MKTYRTGEIASLAGLHPNTIRLYEEIGFQMLGTLPHGFRKKDGSCEDICLYYIDLQK